MAGGRPRTVSPQPAECERLGQEMLEWVKANNPTHLSEWFSIEKMIPWKTWNAMCELPEFLPYYEVALSIVANNARNGTLDKSIAQRFLSLYHRDLKKDERDDKAYEYKLKAETDIQVNEAISTKYDAFMSMLKDAQARNIEDKSISKDK